MSEEKFYRCIPELNKECKKNNCYINGGECETTIYKKYTLKGLLEEIERLNKENEKFKKGLNKLLQLNNYMVNFSSKKVIGKLIVKQRDLIYELLEGRPRGIMHGSKGVDKE